MNKKNKLVVGIIICAILLVLLGVLLIFMISKANKKSSNKENDTTTLSSDISLEKTTKSTENESDTDNTSSESNLSDDIDYVKLSELTKKDMKKGDQASLMDYEYYNKGHLLISDEDYAKQNDRMILKSASFASDEDVKSTVTKIRDYYKNGDFENGAKTTFDFFNSHYFNDSVYARIITSLNNDSTFVDGLSRSNTDDESIRIINYIKDPLIVMSAYQSLKDQYPIISNPDSCILNGPFTISDYGVRLENTDDHYETANHCISYTPTDIYRFHIVKDNISYYAYMGFDSNNQPFLLQYETTNGDLNIFNSNLDQEIDDNKYGFDSGIYNNRGDD